MLCRPSVEPESASTHVVGDATPTSLGRGADREAAIVTSPAMPRHLGSAFVTARRCRRVGTGKARCLDSLRVGGSRSHGTKPIERCGERLGDAAQLPPPHRPGAPPASVQVLDLAWYCDSSTYVMIARSTQLSRQSEFLSQSLLWPPQPCR